MCESWCESLAQKNKIKPTNTHAQIFRQYIAHILDFGGIQSRQRHSRACASCSTRPRQLPLSLAPIDATCMYASESPRQPTSDRRACQHICVPHAHCLRIASSMEATLRQPLSPLVTVVGVAAHAAARHTHPEDQLLNHSHRPPSPRRARPACALAPPLWRRNWTRLALGRAGRLRDACRCRLFSWRASACAGWCRSPPCGS